jgi:glutathione S-transferase
MDVSDTQEFFCKLNEHLSNFSYMNGFSPTQADSHVYRFLSSQFPPPQNLPHILRWYKHIQSFKEVERDKFPKHIDQFTACTLLIKLPEVGILW